MNLLVETNYANSPVVVWRNKEHYIDTYRDARYPGVTFIQAVRRGHVYFRERALDNDERPGFSAPERIIYLMKQELLNP